MNDLFVLDSLEAGKRLNYVNWMFLDDSGMLV